MAIPPISVGYPLWCDGVLCRGPGVEELQCALGCLIVGRVYDEFQVRVAVDAEALVGESDVTYHGMAEGFETSAFLGNFATFTKSAES